MSAFRQNLDKDQNLDKQINSKKILQKNSQKTSKQILKFRPKKSKKIQKNFQTISQNIPKFSKYPIPYIALRGRKPFRAFLTKKLMLSSLVNMLCY